MLSPLQERVARLVADLPGADRFALAGGAALVALHIVQRGTRDLDYFGPGPDDVDQLATVVRDALRSDGLDITADRLQHGFARFTITDGTDTTEVDLGHDARIRPAEPGPYGPTLALDDLAADKTLALFGRAQPRDFIDVHALTAHYRIDQLCALATEKDPGFTAARFAEALGVLTRYSNYDLGLDTDARRRLDNAVAEWRELLNPTLAAQPPKPVPPSPDHGMSL